MKQANSNTHTRGTLKVAGKDVSVPALRPSSSVSQTGISDWRSVVAKFISGLDVRESSRSLYTRTLSQYFLWIEKTGRDLNSLSREDILEYKDSLLSSGLSALTISSYLVVVRKFYEWTESLLIYPNIAKGIKTPRRKQAFKKQHLPEGKSRELLEYSKETRPEEKIREALAKLDGKEITEEQIQKIESHYKGIALRDFAIVNLLLRTGLRTIEVVRADIQDITFKGDRRVLLIWGKGHTEKDSFVVLTDKAYLPIREYLNSRKGAKPGDPLFISESRHNKGGRLTTRTISSICKEGLREIGLDGREFTAHSLRHTTAVEILKNGGEITDVQRVLRHTSPATSQIYTESIEEELRLQKSPEALLDNVF
jgi:integrase/recombinase XerD